MAHHSNGKWDFNCRLPNCLKAKQLMSNFCSTGSQKAVPWLQQAKGTCSFHGFWVAITFILGNTLAEWEAAKW